MKNLSTLTCIIVKYKSNHLYQSLISILSVSQITTVLSDNFSGDTPPSLKKNGKYYKYIDNKSNIGFGSGANAGAKIAKSEWLLFLNTDIEMTANDAKMLVRRALEQDIVAGSPYSEDMRYRQPLPSFWWFLAYFTPLRRFSIFTTLASRAPTTLWGGCLLIKKEVFDKLGGFDERFFLWFEDSDLTKRLLDNGYKIGRVNIPEITHIGGESFIGMSDRDKKRIFFESASMYVKIHGSWYNRVIVFLLKLRYVH
jgi:GT2 family glycosyltransferase